MNAVAAWSYSRFAMYETCPLQFKLTHIDKLEKPTSKAMERGNEIHKGVANHIQGNPLCPPDALKHPFPAKLINEFRRMDDSDRVVEQQWGFTSSWESTGWFGKTTWFRAIMDAVALYEDLTADVVDWKTGKRYDSNADQQELNAVATFCRYKPATHVTTRMVYLDDGGEDVAEFSRSELDNLKSKWERKVAQMFSDTTFAPRPNDKCRFCPFARSKQGQCRFG